MISIYFWLVSTDLELMKMFTTLYLLHPIDLGFADVSYLNLTKISKIKCPPGNRDTFWWITVDFNNLC